MRAAPQFWGKAPGFAADLLWPLGTAWDAVGRLRRALARPYRPPLPVVCVGNLVTGGAGKTPVTMALADWLAARGLGVHVVSRGYGGRLTGPCRADPVRDDAAAVGDEPLLLARHATCWVARDRTAGIAAASAAGAEIILLDDGFQNPSVAKTLGLLVIDAAYGFGNGRVMPAGPLRENPVRGLARADAAILLAAEGEESPAAIGFNHCPVVPAVLAPVDGDRFAGRRVVAFAGIGRPQKFFASLTRLGAEPIVERRFPDHYRFRAGDIEMLRRAADRERALLVTTAKDFMRLPAALRAAVAVLEVEVRWPDPTALDRLLAPIVRSARGNECSRDRPAG
jgi:tetraacyldisaccharide 4'-kinase